MKISEITVDIAKEYLRLDYEETLLPLILTGAKYYIKNYTGIKEDIELDLKEDLTIAYLALIADMHDNRAITVEKDKVNKIIDSILFMNSKLTL